MTLRTYQPAFTAGELAPSLWARVDLSKFQSGLKKALNVFVHAHGGVSNRSGTEFVREVKTSAKKTVLIPFQFSADQSYILEFGDGYVRFFRDGGLILSGGSPYEVATPYAEGDLDDIVFAQEADVMYLTHPSYPIKKLSRFAETNWTLTTPTFAPSMTAPATVTASALVSTSGETGYVATTYRYKVSAISATTGEESLPSVEATCVNDLSIDGGKNKIEWTAVAGAVRYIIFKYSAGAYGYIGGTESLAFEDQNLTADTSDTPQKGYNPFDGANNYPRAVSFIEQRLGFAATNANPQAIYLSQSSNYENFGYSSPAKASDAVTFRIRSRQVNVIRSMISLKGLLVLTSAAEWLVTGGSQSDAITPSAIKIDPQGYRGVSKVQPLVVGNTVLFPQRTGGVVRDFSYQFADDAFTGKDLTVLARHLFKGREIKSWAYSQAPNSIVWVVLTDGSLVSLTYMREHEVWAWTQHSSGASAQFESVVAIPEGSNDVPYFVVRRTINGIQKRYIERMRPREFASIVDAFFVDCGLTYDGSPVTTISGLDHLEGQSVVALADGNVVRNLVVTGGAIHLQFPASVVHIGLPYVSAIRTLDLDLGSVAGIGSVQGRMKTISNVVMRVEDTRGIFIGPNDVERDDPSIVEYKQRSTEAWSEATRVYTGDIEITPMWDWNTHGNMVVKQFDPLPMTILSIMPEVTVGNA